MDAIYGRPELSKDMGVKRFREFYYLDYEMAEFCKKNGLNDKGGRQELIERLTVFLGGERAAAPKFILKNEGADSSVISHDTLIERGFVFSGKHAAYFEGVIGRDFVPYEEFIIWLEVNAGKTYGEAANFWYLLHDDLSSV